MQVRALKSFCGCASMCPGDVKDLPDEIAKELIRSGLCEKAAPEKPAKKASGKSAKKDEG